MCDPAPGSIRYYINSIENHKYGGIIPKVNNARLEDPRTQSSPEIFYPWMISPAYKNDEEGYLRPYQGKYTFFHRFFGRFLTSNGVTGENVLVNKNIDGSGFWKIVDASGNEVYPLPLKEGTFSIIHSPSGKYLGANGGNHVYLRIGKGDDTLWKITPVDDILIEVFKVEHVQTTKYLRGVLEVPLSNMKVWVGSYLPFLYSDPTPRDNNPHAQYQPLYNFMCQKGWDNLYNYTPGSGTVKDCCGRNINITSDMYNQIQSWKESLSSYPCLDVISTKSVWKGNASTPPPSTQVYPIDGVISFDYKVPDPGSCQRNWNNVFTDTSRFPCSPYAYFLDPESTDGHLLTIPIPSSVYLQCLDKQKSSTRKPNNQQCSSVLRVSPNATGYAPNTPFFQIPAKDFCVCNCINTGLDEDKCNTLCKNSSGTAPGVQNNGYFWDKFKEKCVKVSSSTPGEGTFPDLKTCEEVNSTPSGGSNGSGGAFSKSWIVLLVIIVILVLIGVFIDTKRRM